MRQETGDASKMRCGLGFRRFGSGRVHFRDFEAPMPEMPFFARYIKGLGIATRAPGHRLPDRVISRGLRKFACHAMGRTESAYFTGQIEGRGIGAPKSRKMARRGLNSTHKGRK